MFGKHDHMFKPLILHKYAYMVHEQCSMMTAIELQAICKILQTKPIVLYTYTRARSSACGHRARSNQSMFSVDVESVSRELLYMFASRL